MFFSPSCAVWTLSPKSLVAAAGHRLFLPQLLRPLRLLRLHQLLRLPAFIPYAKVKKLILTHYILFIWQDRCMFFSDAAFPSRMLFPLFPMDLPGSSIFATAPRPASSAAALQPAVSLPLRRPWPAASSRWLFAAAPQPATNLIRRRRVLRFG